MHPLSAKGGLCRSVFGALFGSLEFGIHMVSHHSLNAMPWKDCFLEKAAVGNISGTLSHPSTDGEAGVFKWVAGLQIGAYESSQTCRT